MLRGMSRRSGSFLLAAAVFVALAAFVAGRASIDPHKSGGAFAPTEKEGDHRSFSAAQAEARSGDVGNVTIENIGQLEFDQGYRFLRAASGEQLAQWTAGVGMMAERFVYGDADDRMRSPEFAADWMLRFQPQVWKGGMDRVISEWKFKNPEELFAWMTKLPQDVQEGVVSHYESYGSKEDVEEEFTRVMKIGDLTLRDLLLKRVVLLAARASTIRAQRFPSR